jgi:hypothetical protein
LKFWRDVKFLDWLRCPISTVEARCILLFLLLRIELAFLWKDKDLSEALGELSEV